MAKGHRSQVKKERNEERKQMEKLRPKAHANYVRISDTKARIVLDQIKGKNVGEAKAILAYSPRYAAYIIGKVLDSAVANAQHNLEMDSDRLEKLYVQEAIANKGSAHYSRFRIRPRAKGRAYRIERKVSHISIVLNER